MPGRRQDDQAHRLANNVDLAVAGVVGAAIAVLIIGILEVTLSSGAVFRCLL